MRIIAAIVALALWIAGHYTAAPVIDLGAVCIPQACAIGVAVGLAALGIATYKALTSNRPVRHGGRRRLSWTVA